MLVGSVGLVLAVPVTTALAAAVLGADDSAPRGDHDHGGLGRAAATRRPRTAVLA
jgi:hypothetical protein